MFNIPAITQYTYLFSHYYFVQEIKPSGALLLPGCTIRQMEPLEDQNHSLQITRPDGSTVWLAADSDQDCMEWKDLLSIAASRRRSQVLHIEYKNDVIFIEQILE